MFFSNIVKSYDYIFIYTSMKVIKFVDFIKENVSDTPEEYIKMTLIKMKRKIEGFFDSREESNDDVSTMSDAMDRGREKSNRDSDISFKDLGLKLESSEISKYSSLYDNLVVKFSDPEFMYNLYITIPIPEALGDGEGDMSTDKIKNCFIKFKKYSVDNFDLIGQITKNVELKKVDEDYLVQLKIELDDEFDQKEDIGIETE
jgi:hypothetical protein